MAVLGIGWSGPNSAQQWAPWRHVRDSWDRRVTPPPDLVAREEIEAYVAQVRIARARLDASRAEVAARRVDERSAVAAVRSLQVNAPADLRVQRVFAVVGSRVGTGTALFDVPEIVAARCRALMARPGLVFGCFDFIVTETGDWVYLEVNEMGQFLFLEAWCPPIQRLQPCASRGSPGISIGFFHRNSKRGLR